jgi:hypothetical protein
MTMSTHKIDESTDGEVIVIDGTRIQWDGVIYDLMAIDEEYHNELEYVQWDNDFWRKE